MDCQLLSKASVAQHLRLFHYLPSAIEHPKRFLQKVHHRTLFQDSSKQGTHIEFSLVMVFSFEAQLGEDVMTMPGKCEASRSASNKCQSLTFSLERRNSAFAAGGIIGGKL